MKTAIICSTLLILGFFALIAHHDSCVTEQSHHNKIAMEYMAISSSEMAMSAKYAYLSKKKGK